MVGQLLFYTDRESPRGGDEDSCPKVATASFVSPNCQSQFGKVGGDAQVEKTWVF